MKLHTILRTSVFVIGTAISAFRGDPKLQKHATNLRLGKVKTSLAALALALLSTGSFATIVSSGSNNPLDFNWSYDAGPSMLTGSGSMLVSGFNSSVLTATITLTNTSPLASNVLTAFGFGIGPNPTSVSFVDANDAGFVGAGGAPGGISLGNGISVDICVWGGSNCFGSSGIFGAGGSNTDTFSVLLSGIWGNSVSIEPLVFKYSTGFGSYTFTSDMTGPPPPDVDPPSSVPEPGTGALAMLSLGLLGAGFALRRRPPPASA